MSEDRFAAIKWCAENDDHFTSWQDFLWLISEVERLQLCDKSNISEQARLITERDLAKATIATLRETLNPYGRMFSGKGGSPDADWYEEVIFNEERLYESLGKEDARTVLYVWRRYRRAVEALATMQEKP